ncbi:hypothetical protein D3874_16420 [Oleomonas cavernae]|uniref:Uncharacterized protein n=1 Tax=Oleomonas cavernae TaxID=2320859 RepID=A0A418WEI5_9PROT|nr:hypothetical protein [Oleomonas cavernae]RJF88406.1 hypothetical protein D3874_16420 [Oleomonas cavernae]
MAQIARWAYRLGGVAALLGLLFVVAGPFGANFYVEHLDAPSIAGGYDEFRSWTKKADFARRIIAPFRDGTNPAYEVGSIRQAQDIADQYKESIALALLDDDLDEKAQEVALIVAECLSLDDYLALVARLQREGRTIRAAGTLIRTILSTSQWPPMDRNYQDLRVKSMLEALRDSPAANKEIRERAERVLSGEAASFIQGNYAEYGCQLE